jgi:hypothetical protein
METNLPRKLFEGGYRFLVEGHYAHRFNGTTFNFKPVSEMTRKQRDIELDAIIKDAVYKIGILTTNERQKRIYQTLENRFEELTEKNMLKDCGIKWLREHRRKYPLTDNVTGLAISYI